MNEIIALNELEQVFGGDCHCVAYVLDSYKKTIGIEQFGLVPYGNNCKDIIANVTKSYSQLAKWDGRKFEFLGCYDSDDNQEQLSQKQKGE